MPKEYKHDGETFQLDDSKGCYVEISYEGEVVGYVGVALNGGTNAAPYAYDYWDSNQSRWVYRRSEVTPDGLERGASVPDMNSGLEGVCFAYLSSLRAQRERAEFKPEAACEALHKYVEELPG